MSHVTMSDRNMVLIPDVLTHTVDNQHTAGVNLRGFPILGLLVPVVNAGTITVEISIDGTNWYALKKADGTTAAISITGGATAFFVGSDEFTQLAAYCGSLRDAANNIRVRLATGGVQDASRTFTWIGVA